MTLALCMDKERFLVLLCSVAMDSDAGKMKNQIRLRLTILCTFTNYKLKLNASQKV